MAIPLVDLTGIGENAADIVLRLRDFPCADGKTDTVSRSMRLGGQVATAVIAAAKWGLSVRYVGAIGTDSSGDLHQQAFHESGVDARLQRVHRGESRLSYILVHDETGSRAVLCHRDPKVLMSRPYIKKEWFERSRLVHLDGDSPQASLQAAVWARAAGVPVMCDLDVFNEPVRKILSFITYPVLSMNILEGIGGSADPLIALPLIHSRFGGKTVCATMGERGAVAWDGSRFWYSSAYRVKVLDTTGAGDLFHAGFAFGILRGLSISDILSFGCAAAGLNCTAEGARGGIATLREIANLRSTGKRHPAHYTSKDLACAAEQATRVPPPTRKA